MRQAVAARAVAAEWTPACRSSTASTTAISARLEIGLECRAFTGRPLITSLDSDPLEADTVIVGAGTMGLALATALADAGHEVLLIEAGGLVATTAANTETTEAFGRTHRGTHQGRANGLGGTSTLWGGQLVEFDDEDFTRAYAPWPISRADLEPWYRQVHRRLGVGEPLDFAAYRRRLGGEAGSASGIERFFTAWLPEPNFARLFKRRALSDPKVRILCDATCSGIEFTGAAATSLRIVSGGRAREVKARRFVFAMGTIATLRFFLSTARSSAVPWRHDAKIGRYFQDHLAGRVGNVTIGDETTFRNYFENAVVDGVKLQPKLRVAAVQRSEEDANAIGISGYFVFGSDMSEHLANLKQMAKALSSAAGLSTLRELPRAMYAVGSGLAPFVWRYLRDRRVMAFFDKSLEFQVQCEQMPIATSQVRLAGDAPAADGLFKAVVDWQVQGSELARIRQFARSVDQYLRARNIGQLQIDPRLDALDPAFMDTLVDTNHQSGGMPMGASADSGVVDPDLRVFGTANVYVAGAVVFPSSSHANCTFTALALTERLAAKLAGEAR